MADELGEDGQPEGASEQNRIEDPWSAARARTQFEEKSLMAREFVNHEFLVPQGGDPEGSRETAASILVNQGTSQVLVVEEALEWMKRHWNKGPFFLTWYTTGHLIPTTLKEAREQYRNLRTATSLFLLPGEVDLQTESVSGPDAEEFTNKLQRRFTYTFLSAYAFDVCTGSVYFHWPSELKLQMACATRFAAHKFLFLDSSKFKSEGEEAYGIRDLLETAHRVTIYTVSSRSPDRDLWIRKKFANLCTGLLKEVSRGTEDDDLSIIKTLRLVIVGCDKSASSFDQRTGVLI